jgi:hypothetical protein
MRSWRQQHSNAVATTTLLVAIANFPGHFEIPGDSAAPLPAALATHATTCARVSWSSKTLTQLRRCSESLAQQINRTARGY